MHISFYEDGERKNITADFYDPIYPTIFLRGLLEVSQETEKDIQLTIVSRHDKEANHERGIL